MGNNHLAATIETSADELVGELKAVRDSVEELYILLDHMWRNREEIHDILVGIIEKRTEDSHEVTCCVHCDDSHSSLADAIRAGWSCIQHDPSDGWDYLGICADCRRNEIERDAQVTNQEHDVETIGREMGLTEEQIAQAKAEGVTTALGLRRIEKNTRADQIPESIACARCDVDSPKSIAAALQEGWTDLCRDDGAGWNYLGVCPQCQAQEQAEDEKLKKAEQQKRLFG